MAEGTAGDGGSGDGVFTQTQVDEAVAAALVEAKGDSDVAYKKVWDEGKAAKAKLRDFGDLDPEIVRDQLKKLSDLEQLDLKKQAGLTDDQLKKLRSSIRSDAEKEFAPFKVEAEKLRGKVRELNLDNVVKKLMAENGVRGERVDALFRLTSDKFDLTEDGSPMLVDFPGREVDKYIGDDLAKDWPEFFKSSGSSGGGATKSIAGGGGNVRTIAKGDNAALLANLEGVAKGEVEVVG